MTETADFNGDALFQRILGKHMKLVSNDFFGQPRHLNRRFLKTGLQPVLHQPQAAGNDEGEVGVKYCGTFGTNHFHPVSEDIYHA